MADKTIRILLVEDDKVDQMAFERFVNKENLPYEYIVAGSVAEAKDVLKSTSFDIIISDYVLGDGTSFELFESYKGTPVIVTTGSGDEAVAVQAMKLGACDYLIKDPEGNYLTILPVTVDLALKRKQNEDELQNYHERLETMVVERTAQLQAEMVERKKLALTYQELVEGTTDLITQVDAEGTLLFVNHMGKTFFGSDPEKLIGQGVLQFIHPEDREKTEAWLKDNLGKQVTQSSIENRQVNPGTGDVYDLLWTANFHYDEQGQLTSINGIAHDITERKKAEAAIRKSEEQWHRTFNSFSDVVTLQDLDLNIVKANKSTSDLLGLPQEMVADHHCYEVFCGLEEPCQVCPVLETGKTFKPYSKEIYHEKLGKTFLVSASPVFGEQGELEYIAHVAKDITEMKQLQSQLLQAQKMEAVGLMAGGMAHNFNNNLAIILGNVELAQIKIPAASDVIEYLKNAKIAVLRSRDLIQQILTFSRKGEKDIVPMQPAVIVDETLALIRSTMPSTVNLQEVISISSRDISIKADPSRIQEILLNLCNNAVHAMEETGDLTVSLEAVLLQPQDIPALYGCLPGRYVQLSVQDSGSGITEETQQKIFDPFFTTKDVGKGTGMGLSTVYGIVEQHNGMIKVRSSVGQGTTFEIYFPVIEFQQLESSSVIHDLPRGDEKILFLDDDEMLANVWSQMLTEHGYKVSTMTNSIEAVKLFAANPDYFDLVITDQTMPELSGQDFIRELLSIRPKLLTILCTGYSSKIDEDKAKKQGIKAFCMKPLDLAELLETIRRVLDEAQLASA